MCVFVCACVCVCAQACVSVRACMYCYCAVLVVLAANTQPCASCVAAVSIKTLQATGCLQLSNFFPFRKTISRRR